MGIEGGNRGMIDLTPVSRQELFLPDFYVDKVTDIDFKKLRQMGVRYALLDVDNTLTRNGENVISEEVEQFLNKAVAEDELEKIFLVSNSRRDFTQIASSIDAQVVRCGILFDRKPSRSFFGRVLETAGCEPHEAVMVGDKITIDIYGGKRSGVKTVLVSPIGPGRVVEYIFGMAQRENLHKKRLEEALRAK